MGIIDSFVHCDKSSYIMQTKVKTTTKFKHLNVSLDFDHEHFQSNVLKEDPTTLDVRRLACTH